MNICVQLGISLIVYYLFPDSSLEWLIGMVPFNLLWCFPGGPSVTEPTYQCRRHGFNPWVGNIPWKRKQQPTPVFLAWEFSWTEEPDGL